VLRALEFPQYGILPQSLTKGLETKAPAFWKWANAVIAKESVRYIWDGQAVADRTKARIAKLKAEAASK
jgi:glutathione S-transferase